VKWARRNPMALALAGVCTAAAFALVLGMLWYNVSLQRQLEEARRAGRQAELHAEVEKLLREGEEAFTRGNYPLALSRLKSAVETIHAEPAPFEDIRNSAEDLLAKTEPR